MAKITIDPRVRGIEGCEVKKEFLQKVFQVALTTICRLKKIEHLATVEIVKITWTTDKKWEIGKDPLVTNFQVVSRLFSDEKLRVILRLEPGGTVSIHKDDPEKDGSYITSWVARPIKELEVENIANLLLQAMGLVAGKHVSLCRKAVTGFERIRDGIENALPAKT